MSSHSNNSGLHEIDCPRNPCSCSQAITSNQADPELVVDAMAKPILSWKEEAKKEAEEKKAAVLKAYNDAAQKVDAAKKWESETKKTTKCDVGDKNKCKSKEETKCDIGDGWEMLTSEDYDEEWELVDDVVPPEPGLENGDKEKTFGQNLVSWVRALENYHLRKMP